MTNKCTSLEYLLTRAESKYDRLQLNMNTRAVAAQPKEAAPAQEQTPNMQDQADTNPQLAEELQVLKSKSEFRLKEIEGVRAEKTKALEELDKIKIEVPA